MKVGMLVCVLLVRAARRCVSSVGVGVGGGRVRAQAVYGVCGGYGGWGRSSPGNCFTTASQVPHAFRYPSPPLLPPPSSSLCLFL